MRGRRSRGLRRQKSSRAEVWERCKARRERMAWTPESDQRIPGCLTRSPETCRREDATIPKPIGRPHAAVAG